MRGKGIAIVAILVAAYAQMGGTLPVLDDLKIPDLFKPATPEVVVPAPPIDLQAIARPVTTALAGHPSEAAQVAVMMTQLADLVGRNDDLTTGQVRNTFAATGRILQAQLSVSVPGLGEAMDKVFAESIGLENRALDATTKARVVETCKAVAWAAQQAK